MQDAIRFINITFNLVPCMTIGHQNSIKLKYLVDWSCRNFFDISIILYSKLKAIQYKCTDQMNKLGVV